MFEPLKFDCTYATCKMDALMVILHSDNYYKGHAINRENFRRAPEKIWLSCASYNVMSSQRSLRIAKNTRLQLDIATVFTFVSVLIALQSHIVFFSPQLVLVSYSQLAFCINLWRAVIGPSATLTG